MSEVINITKKDSKTNAREKEYAAKAAVFATSAVPTLAAAFWSEVNKPANKRASNKPYYVRVLNAAAKTDEIEGLAEVCIAALTDCFVRHATFNAAAISVGSKVLAAMDIGISTLKKMEEENYGDEENFESSGDGDVSDTDEQNVGMQVQIGACLLEIMAMATQAFGIVQTFAERPNLDSSGQKIKIPLGYVLEPKSGEFLEWAAKTYSVGSPKYSLRKPRDWGSQKVGGAKGQRGGLVHGAGKYMTATSETAERFFGAANALQSVAFRVNPVSALVVDKYDKNKALKYFKDRLTEEDAAKPEGERIAASMSEKVRRGVLRGKFQEAELSFLAEGVPPDEAIKLAEGVVGALPASEIDALVAERLEEVVAMEIKRRASELVRL